MENEEITSFDDLPTTGEPYNYLDDRYLEASYTELVEGDRYVGGFSKITWDERTINVEIQLSVDMTDHRMLDIFQKLLLDCVNAAEHEKGKRNNGN